MVMYYIPHRIFKKVVVDEVRDEYGRVLPAKKVEWLPCSRCRCDKNSDTSVVSDNGDLYNPTWHIAVEGTTSIVAGDEVRVETLSGEFIAEGKVTSVKKTNYLHNSEIWI